MRHRLPLLLLLFAVAALLSLWERPAVSPVEPPASGTTTAPASVPAADWLPAEALHTLELIRRDGPFPHRQDGTVFYNREGRLPPRATGYYREYTVRTPGLGHRGARRIVTGGQPPEVYYYTDDHYGSFRRFELPR
ncbi:ribonuclease domain-containing protein [Wenzhouxiangella sp. XN24]|uniref:ribonuclease domain-containing protein n=1 Tax=Wenzhouxiangella sp. XN24 TaxID=2713569 RepID=UPI0013EA853E|nr:ribonuclease domain-containing protein [Wenzhouxiangella sp. XN24]NGX14762.1 ribonuclease [Wenzhouxiangella sp. XN24]